MTQSSSFLLYFNVFRLEQYSANSMLGCFLVLAQVSSVENPDTQEESHVLQLRSTQFCTELLTESFALFLYSFTPTVKSYNLAGD